MAVQLWLAVSRGPHMPPALQDLVVTREGAVIGRQGREPVALSLGSDPVASRRHCRLWSERDEVWLEDLRSQSGTYLNGRLLTAPSRVQPDDEVRVGATVLRLRFGDRYDPAADAEGADLLVDTDDADGAEQVGESRRLELLAGIAGPIARASGAAGLELVLSQIAALFPRADGVGLMCDRGELLPLADFPAGRCQASFRLARRAIETRRAVLWRRRIDLETGAPHTSLRKLTSAVYAPIQGRDGPCGVVSVSSSAVDAELGPADAQVLSVIAALLTNLDALGGHKPAARLFVSYSRPDAPAVRRLARHLRRRNLSVWFDERLRAGEHWREQVAEVIRAADAFVLWLSPTALASEPVSWELERARELGLPVWPILGAPCELPAHLRDIHHLSAGDDLEPVAAEVAALACRLRGDS